MNTEKNKDAQTRATRTLLQGLVLTALTAAFTAAVEVLPSPDSGEIDWASVGSHAGYAALFAAGMAIASYLHRMTESE